MMKILIGYDGSECADRAIEDLRRAGLPRDVEAIVLSAADVWVLPSSEGEGATADAPKVDMIHFAEAQQTARQTLQAAEGLAAKASARLREIFPAWTVTPEVQADSPAWALIKKSDEWKPDLLVVGPKGHSVISRVIFGSVSRKVVTEARCSVRVARGDASVKEGPVRLVIGLDGSPHSEAAVSAVAAREWPTGSEAILVSVLDTAILTSWEWFEALTEDEETWAEKVMTGPARRLTDAGLSVSSKIEHGDPKHALIEKAEEWKADCIFVGAKGLRGIDRLMLGSVASSIAARAHSSVEVVRKPQ